MKIIYSILVICLLLSCNNVNKNALNLKIGDDYKTIVKKMGNLPDETIKNDTISYKQKYVKVTTLVYYDYSLASSGDVQLFLKEDSSLFDVYIP